MTDSEQIFLSYSHNDLDAAELLRAQLGQHAGPVFKDDDSIREGDLWLEHLQEAVDACSAFVVLVGQDGVRRWIGAETQVALSRHFGPHNDSERLPIFPVLLGDTRPEDLPAFLRLFQATAWNGTDGLPDRLLDRIRERANVPDGEPAFEGCPYVGLGAYTEKQAHLFFGRQKETLDALKCFEIRRGAAPVRWLEISGNSGSGKSSLMNAGLLPLVDAGWLWPRSRIEHWKRIGPMMPGANPVVSLAEHLARAFGEEMADVRSRLQGDDERALADWLRGRKPDDDTAFLLALDQFEELFTFAEPDERTRFDRLLATALDDPDCPLFVISTVRADFLDRFDDLPALVGVRNRMARPWTLPPVGGDGLREIIGGPARLAGLDVSAVQEAMVAEARGEPGALPLVENALHWLWQQRENDRLSGRLFTQSGGLAGILSQGADDLLAGLGQSRKRALELLFRLVNVDPEGRRHTRRRIPLAEAVAVAGGGEAGHALIARLAGQRDVQSGAGQRPLRLITVTGELAANGEQDAEEPGNGERWVNLIHETLIRASLDEQGRPRPYWPALWDYIEKNKHRAARRERLRLQAREWQEKGGLGRLFGLAGWASMFGFRGLAAHGSVEARYLRWSRVSVIAQGLIVAAVIGLTIESISWASKNEYPATAIYVRWMDKLGFDPPHAELVPIDAGDFVMADDQENVLPVMIGAPFFLGKTEVTFEHYDAYRYLSHPGVITRSSDEGWGRFNRPVINVDWEEARDYATWLGTKINLDCRLPSEAEWEYAARAGTTTKYALPLPGGGDSLTGLANCSGCGSPAALRSGVDPANVTDLIGHQTIPVGSFEPNAWGLHDMHGNVLEWVEDCWHDSYVGAPADGRAWLEEEGGQCDRRMLRGGGWIYDQASARSAYPFNYYFSKRSDGIGFRVLCSSPIP